MNLQNRDLKINNKMQKSIKKQEGTDCEEVLVPIVIIHSIEEYAILYSSIKDNAINAYVSIRLGVVILVEVSPPCD